jgi:putative transposase
VKRKKRKRLVRGGQPQLTASAPDQQWAIDFVHDRLASGRTIRMLTVVDAFTRECLALEVDSSLPSRGVTRALEAAAAFYCTMCHGLAGPMIQVD